VRISHAKTLRLEYGSARNDRSPGSGVACQARHIVKR
jgi:hypothetical protein